MNKFTTISTKDYTPLSYKEEYFHNNNDSTLKNFVISNSVLLGWFSAFLLLLGFTHWIFTH